MHEIRNNMSSAIAWLALVIAIIAVFIGWLAYNRTGVDLERRIETEVRMRTGNAIDEAQKATERANQAAERLERDIRRPDQQ